MLHSIIARLIASSPVRLVSFFHTLEARLNSFLAAHELEVQAIRADIEQVESWAAADIAAIKAKAEDGVRDLTTKIAEKEANAIVVATIKAALPTAGNQPKAEAPAA